MAVSCHEPMKYNWDVELPITAVPTVCEIALVDKLCFLSSLPVLGTNKNLIQCSCSLDVAFNGGQSVCGCKHGTKSVADVIMTQPEVDHSGSWLKNVLV